MFKWHLSDNEKLSAFLLAGFIVILFLIYLLSSTAKFYSTVLMVGNTIEHSASIYSVKLSAGFEEYIPTLAYDIQEQDRRFHHTDCYGTGSKKKCRDVYKTWFSFRYNAWLPYQNVQQITKNHTIRLPALDIVNKRKFGTVLCDLKPSQILYEQSEDRLLGCWKDDGYTYHYWIVLFDWIDVETKKCYINKNIWDDINIGDLITGKRGLMNREVICASIQ